MQASELTWDYWKDIKKDYVDVSGEFWQRQRPPSSEEVKSISERPHPIEIIEQAHNLNKPTRALNCFNTQNAGRSINSHNMNKLQSALQKIDIEHP